MFKAILIGYRAFLSMLFLYLLIGQLGCSNHQSSVKSVPLSVAHLKIICEPSEALIFVDDRYVGIAVSLRKKNLILPEGIHRVEVRKDGYFPEFREVKVSSGHSARLTIQLKKEPF